MEAHNNQLQALQDKLALVKGDRDDKDKVIKKLKTNNEDLRKKLKDLETKNDQMSLKIEQNYSGGVVVSHATQPGSTGAKSQQKYNSIDVGYDESNFNLNSKNSRTNTNVSQKRIIQST